MSGQGFGKQASDDIQFSSIVSGKTGDPFIIMTWGKEEGKLTPREAMAHAVAVMQVAAAAIIDAQLVQWAMSKLSMSQQQAVMLLRLFREKREKGRLPSLTLNMNGEHLRAETVKRMGCQYLEMAFMTEAEAFLAAFLLENIKTDTGKIDIINSGISRDARCNYALGGFAMITAISLLITFLIVEGIVFALRLAAQSLNNQMQIDDDRKNDN